MSEPVITSKDAGVLTVRLAREDKKNAITGAMYTAIADALDAAEADDDVRAILITGGERCFSAGNDLNDFVNPNRDGSGVARMMTRLPELKKPIVAAVNGVAVGIGTTLLLHCDLVYVGRSARLILPFVDLGVVPELGSSRLLPRLVGPARAAELLLLCEPIDGARAAELGIATAVLEDSEVQSHAVARARALAEKPPRALRLTKELLRAEAREGIATVVDLEMRLFAEVLGSAEAQEAITAKLGKRKPDFSRL